MCFYTKSAYFSIIAHFLAFCKEMCGYKRNCVDTEELAYWKNLLYSGEYSEKRKRSLFVADPGEDQNKKVARWKKVYYNRYIQSEEKRWNERDVMSFL